MSCGLKVSHQKADTINLKTQCASIAPLCRLQVRCTLRAFDCLDRNGGGAKSTFLCRGSDIGRLAFQTIDLLDDKEDHESHDQKIDYRLNEHSVIDRRRARFFGGL